MGQTVYAAKVIQTAKNISAHQRNRDGTKTQQVIGNGMGHETLDKEAIKKRQFWRSLSVDNNDPLAVCAFEVSSVFNRNIKMVSRLHQVTFIPLWDFIDVDTGYKFTKVVYDFERIQDMQFMGISEEEAYEHLKRVVILEMAKELTEGINDYER